MRTEEYVATTDWRQEARTLVGKLSAERVNMIADVAKGLTALTDDEVAGAVREFISDVKREPITKICFYDVMQRQLIDAKVDENWSERQQLAFCIYVETALRVMTMYVPTEENIEAMIRLVAAAVFSTRHQIQSLALVNFAEAVFDKFEGADPVEIQLPLTL